MSVTEILPWANLLLIPSFGLLLKISTQLATLQAVQAEHGRRLDFLERRA